MPKAPRLRISYNADGQYLLRLAYAVESDRTRPAEWRRSVMEKLHQLAYDFLGAPDRGEETEKTTQAPQEAATTEDAPAGVPGPPPEGTDPGP